MLVTTDTERQEFIRKVNQVKLNKTWKMTAEVYKATRSQAQNSLLNAWYQSIAKHTGEGFAFTRGQYKWTMGVPILLARGEAEFGVLIEAIVDKMQHEQIIELFSGDKIAVSSVMKVGELTDYLTCIEQDCASRQIPLLRGDEYEQAMGMTNKPRVE